MNHRDIFPMLCLPRPSLALVAIFIGFGYVSEQDYQDAKRTEALQKERKVSPAPIWSKKCQNRGQTTLAKQADGGDWIVLCTGPKSRT